MDYTDVAASTTPRSIHYKVRLAHLTVRQLREETDNEQRDALLNKASAQMDDLQPEIEEFLREVSGLLLYSGTTLNDQVT